MLETLILCMALDYLTGMMAAGIFHKSKKSAEGGLESRSGWKGLCRKGISLLIVLVHIGWILLPEPILSAMR